MGKCKDCKYFKPVNSYCIFNRCSTKPDNGCLEGPILTLATLSEDEMAACLKVVEKMRAEKRAAAKIEEAKMRIYKEVNSTLEEIGLEETKKILRQMNRDLRDMPIGES